MCSKILIIDDESKQLAKLKRAAKGAGFSDSEIVTTTSLEEAEATLKTGEFALAVIDLVLQPLGPSPDSAEDGLQIIRLLRKQQPECRIIALTTKLETKAGVRAFVAGAHDFVCSKWVYINWEELLVQRLRLWRGAVGGRDEALASL